MIGLAGIGMAAMGIGVLVGRWLDRRNLFGRAMH